MRQHRPFHPADAFNVRRAYRHGVQAGKRNPTVPMDKARARWMKRHSGTRLATRLSDWEDGFLDGQMMGGAL